PAQSIRGSAAVLRRILQPTRGRPGSRLSARGHPELRRSPQVLVGQGFWRQQSPGEILLDPGSAEQCRPESSGAQEPAGEEGGAPHDSSRYRHPPEKCPGYPQTAQGYQSNQQIPVAVG